MRFGVIFDWDGVVLDSRYCHCKSWEILAERRGLPLPEGHFERGFGLRNETIIPEVLMWATEAEAIRDLANAKEALYRELALDSGLKSLSGIPELLLELKKKEVPVAIGTSTPRENVQALLPVLGLEGYFGHLVASEDVSRGKPDPEVFLKAAAHLGLKPGQCLVIEDSQGGLEAAQRAGMLGVGVLTTHPSLKADLVVESPAGLNFLLLQNLMKGKLKCS